MAKVTIRQLEVFLEVARHPTLSAAASALHLSESAVSHVVTELERALGERLTVRRKAKGVTLTAAGELVARRARTVVEAIHEIPHELAQGRDGRLAGPVAVGCYNGIADSVLPPVVQRFAEDFPEVRVDIRVGDNDELIEALHEGSLDLAVLYDVNLPTGLTKRMIYPTEVVAVLPADHPLAAGPDVDLADLVAEPLIVLDTRPSRENTLEAFEARGLSPNLRAAIPQIEVVRALVGRGLGYTLLRSRPAVMHRTTEGRPLTGLPLRPRFGRSAVVAAWPSALRPNARTLTVAEVCRGEFAAFR